MPYCAEPAFAQHVVPSAHAGHGDAGSAPGGGVAASSAWDASSESSDCDASSPLATEFASIASASSVDAAWPPPCCMGADASSTSTGLVELGGGIRSPALPAPLHASAPEKANAATAAPTPDRTRHGPLIALTRTGPYRSICGDATGPPRRPMDESGERATWPVILHSRSCR